MVNKDAEKGCRTRIKNREVILAYKDSAKRSWSSDATFIISSTDFAQYLKKTPKY